MFLVKLVSIIKNLDTEMPGIAWDHSPMDLYRAHNLHCFGGLTRKPYASIYTTLGCPYRCGFCCIQAPFKSGEKELGYQPSVNSYRLWSLLCLEIWHRVFLDTQSVPDSAPATL